MSDERVAYWAKRPSRVNYSHQLPPGRWVAGPGGIKRYVADESLAFDGLEPDEADVCRRLARNLTRTTPSKPAEVHTCPDCRCLLTRANETCPGCLAWAERDAIRTSWRCVA